MSRPALVSLGTLLFVACLPTQRPLGESRTCLRLTYDSLLRGAVPATFPEHLELGTGGRRGSVRIPNPTSASDRERSGNQWQLLDDSSNAYLISVTYQHVWLGYRVHFDRDSVNGWVVAAFSDFIVPAQQQGAHVLGVKESCGS